MHTSESFHRARYFSMKKRKYIVIRGAKKERLRTKDAEFCNEEVKHGFCYKNNAGGSSTQTR